MNSHLFIAEDSDIMGFWISWDPFNTSCIIEFGDGFTKHGLYFCFGRYQQSQNYYNDFKSIKKNIKLCYMYTWQNKIKILLISES